MRKGIFAVIVVGLLFVSLVPASSYAFGRFDVWIGGPWPYPYYYAPYYYPYCPPAPPVVIQQQPQVQVQPEPQPQAQPQQYYWYYCQDPKGYYPYIKQCSKPWLKVVPTPPADAKKSMPPDQSNQESKNMPPSAPPEQGPYGVPPDYTGK